ncbi:MAG: TonB-dependent receptor [Muribaculaceae bacterium]|nr:TonB-dependent receptor [Muribaculaceae bacterium]
MKKRISVLAAVVMVTAAVATAQTDTTSVLLDDVVVTGTRTETDARHLPMTISVLNHAALTNQYAQNVLPTVTEQVPGVFVTSRGMLGYGVSTGAAGGIKVRGVGSGADMLVLVDGLPQYAGMYGHPIADAYHTMLAERVEVLRGPASLLYGNNAMGGVMNIVTRKMQRDGVETNITLQAGSYGTVEGGVTNRVRSGRFHSIVGLDYGRTDGHRANSSFNQWNAFVKLGYDLSKAWSIVGDVDLTRFNSSNPGEVTDPYLDNDMTIFRGMAALSLLNDYVSTNGALRLYYNWGHHKINDGYHPGGTPRTSLYLHDDLLAGVSAYQSVTLFEGNRTTFGFDYQHFGGHAFNRAIADGTETDIADKTVDEVAAYVDVRQQLAPWLTLDAGLRFDHHSVSGTEWVPQGGLVFTLPRGAELRALVSKGFRNPTIRELYMYPPQNPDLAPERMMNYELAYKQRLLDNRLRLGLNLFYLNADNIINTVRIDGKPLNVNSGEIKNWGIEADVNFKATKQVTLMANYSFLHMDTPQLAAPEHKLYVGCTWNVRRFTLTTGLHTIVGLYTVTGAEPVTEDYVLWNATASYRTPLRGLTLFVKGENLLAQRYEIMKGFPMPKATVMAGLSFKF